MEKSGFWLLPPGKIWPPYIGGGTLGGIFALKSPDLSCQRLFTEWYNLIVGLMALHPPRVFSTGMSAGVRQSVQARSSVDANSPKRSLTVGCAQFSGLLPENAVVPGHPVALSTSGRFQDIWRLHDTDPGSTPTKLPSVRWLGFTPSPTLHFNRFQHLCPQNRSDSLWKPVGIKGI